MSTLLSALPAVYPPSPTCSWLLGNGLCVGPLAEQESMDEEAAAQLPSRAAVAAAAAAAAAAAPAPLPSNGLSQALALLFGPVTRAGAVAMAAASSAQELAGRAQAYAGADSWGGGPGGMPGQGGMGYARGVGMGPHHAHHMSAPLGSAAAGAGAGWSAQRQQQQQGGLAQGKGGWPNRAASPALPPTQPPAVLTKSFHKRSVSDASVTPTAEAAAARAVGHTPSAAAAGAVGSAPFLGGLAQSKQAQPPPLSASAGRLSAFASPSAQESGLAQSLVPLPGSGASHRLSVPGLGLIPMPVEEDTPHTTLGRGSGSGSMAGMRTGYLAPPLQPFPLSAYCAIGPRHLPGDKR